MSQKTLIVIVTILLALGIGYWVSQARPTQELPVPQESVVASPLPSPGTELSLTAERTGLTAFELLQRSAEVEYQEYDFGVFVTSINGVAADADHFWALYLNDELAQQGASEIRLNAGDTTTWKLEAIQQPAQ